MIDIWGFILWEREVLIANLEDAKEFYNRNKEHILEIHAGKYINDLFCQDVGLSQEEKIKILGAS